MEIWKRDLTGALEAAEGRNVANRRVLVVMIIEENDDIPLLEIHVLIPIIQRLMAFPGRHRLPSFVISRADWHRGGDVWQNLPPFLLQRAVERHRDS